MVKKDVITWSYVRCSTSLQDLGTQTQQLIDYSKAFGFTISQTITDFGVSGSEFDRKGLNEIKDGIVKSANIMRLTLSCDHRLVDGVIGSKFLNTLKNMLESPLMMFY